VAVNRTWSPFGVGWWLAGLEQLVTATNNRWLWVGGDGSFRVYLPVAGDTTAWVADAYDRPDTLRRTGGVFVRRLPGRGEVRFDLTGRQVQTVSPVGHTTTFSWDLSRLTGITLPVTGYAYTFTYGNNGGWRLSSVSAPGVGAARVTGVQTDASGRLTRITEPDGRWVGYDYAGASARVTGRTDRRGWRTRFEYGDGMRLAVSRMPAAVGDTIVRRFRPAETLGLLTATPPQDLYTLLTGPRAEIAIPELTRIFLDRFGAPVKVVDAAGSATTLTRTDARFPGLVTAVEYSNGRKMTAVYDARGNLSASTDRTPGGDGIFPTSTYQWDAYWDAPTRVTLPEGEFTLTSYDAYGRPAWMQMGPDSARRTRFGYYANNHALAPGLIQSVKSPLVNAETYAYDARGNLDTLTAPTGLRTVTMSDVIGRVDSVTSPGGAKRRLTYDAADQVIEEESFGPQRVAHSSFTVDSLYAAEHLWVHTYRNASGQPDSVARWQSPDPAAIGHIVTHWRYDGAGRRIVEIAPDATPDSLTDHPRDSTVYDPAGNPTKVFTRRGFTIALRRELHHLQQQWQGGGARAGLHALERGPVRRHRGGWHLRWYGCALHRGRLARELYLERAPVPPRLWRPQRMDGQPHLREPRRQRAVLPAQPVLRFREGPLHAGGSDRAGGWAECVWVRKR
jgi:YD repeat-containing protein